MTTTATTSEISAIDEAKPASTRHAGLDRDDVIEAALAMVEKGGGEALTMRRLAAELGVATTTIYWHVGNRNELILALIRRQAERQGEARIVGEDPADRIVCAALNVWRNAVAHRNVTALASQVGATTLLELPLEVALVVELEAAGLRGERARDGLRAVLACVAGFLISAWRREEMPEDLNPAALWGSLEDSRLSSETVAALVSRPDLDTLIESTIRSVVEGLLAK